MVRLSGITSSWFFAFLVSIAVCASASGFAAQQAGQAPATASGTTAPNAKTTPAVQSGALYGSAAGDHDGTLRLSPRPSRSPFFSNQAQYKPADGTRLEYLQQYRSAFEKAYRSAYEAALKSQKHPTKPPQRPAKKTGSN